MGDSRSWRRPLLTASERRAKALLDELFEHQGSLILPGFKLSQVIHDRPVGITRDQWTYAIRAHFDFVVCDGKTYVPDFAIELDDPTHLKPEAQRRDRMKDAVCEAAGFELLRIESSALDVGPRGRRLVEYLVEARSFLHTVWEAQNDGIISPDELSTYDDIVELTPDGQLDFVNSLGRAARRLAWKAHERGEVTGYNIYNFHVQWKNGWAEGLAWLEVKSGYYLFRTTRLRSYQFACGILPVHLAEEISTSAIGDDMSALARGEPVLVRKSQIADKFKRLKAARGETEDGWLLDHVHFTDNG